jgi:hypothetical protein
MEKQQLEELLDKYEEWNTHGKDVTLKVKNWQQGTEYDLVYADSKRWFIPLEGAHYHFYSQLYLIYKPKLLVRTVDDLDYDDGPAPNLEAYTELNIQEQKTKVILKYRVNLKKDLIGELKTKKFRWVMTKRQGKKPEFHIEEADYWGTED